MKTLALCLVVTFVVSTSAWGQESQPTSLPVQGQDGEALFVGVWVADMEALLSSSIESKCLSAIADPFEMIVACTSGTL